MLQCLIVDDENHKIDRIRKAVALELGSEGVHFDHVVSAYAATERLRQRLYDLAIVDINLPLRDGEAPVDNGGVRLMRQVARNASGMNRPISMIGLTAHESLAIDAVEDFHLHGWALLIYRPERDDWEAAIVSACAHLKNSLMQRRIGLNDQVDIAIVTALSDTELEAVLALPGQFATTLMEGDSARYSVGRFEAKGRSFSVVACAASEMGNPAAAAITSKLISRFRPRVCFMCGICAGISAEVGDIVVAEQSLHYESGKWTIGEGGESVFRPQPRYIAASSDMLAAIREYKLSNAASVLALPARWRGPRCGRAPVVEIGPVASGAAVIENESIVSSLQFRDRKLVGLEMESYGFYMAASTAVSDTSFVMIKGVCDKASPPKGDDYQKYAAFLSAQFTFDFILHEAEINGGMLS